jgi:hypothetical protein
MVNVCVQWSALLSSSANNQFHDYQKLSNIILNPKSGNQNAKYDVYYLYHSSFASSKLISGDILKRVKTEGIRKKKVVPLFTEKRRQHICIYV